MMGEQRLVLNESQTVLAPDPSPARGSIVPENHARFDGRYGGHAGQTPVLKETTRNLQTGSHREQLALWRTACASRPAPVRPGAGACNAGNFGDAG